MTPLLGPKFDEALQLATELHRSQLRKGSTVPYVSHLMSVAALVLEDGGDEDEAIAALLHDALEDHPEQIGADEIMRRFGPRVLALVVACTDTPPDFAGGKKPPWKQRKDAYIEHIESGRVPWRVSLADKLHNARSILRDHRAEGDAVWERFKASKDETLWYYQRLSEAYRSAGAHGFMIEELERVVAELATRATGSIPPRPISNAYWVQPGHLLAGEYPGAKTADEARTKLNLFLDAGVRSFVDLTEEGESGLEPYPDLLQEEAGRRGLLVEDRRLPIRDVDVPRSRSEMSTILDAIDGAVGRQSTVYVHCWGGSGRTGTVVGCHLVRHGSDGDTALRQVAEWWSTVEKYRRSKHSPQTHEQREYVRTWREP